MSSRSTAQVDCGDCSLAVGEINRCHKYWLLSLRFWFLDIVLGALLGFLIVWFHESLMPSNMPPVWSFLLSMILIMVLQFVLSLFIGSLTGSLEAMIPGTFVGMGAMSVALVPLRGMNLKFIAAASVGFLISLGFVLLDAMSRTRSLRDTFKRQVRPASNPPPFTLPTPAWLYDLLEGAGARRRACPQRRLFAAMGERVLFVAAGSGLNFKHFPPHRSIVAIDVDSKMLERAQCRAKSYDGILRLMNADVQKLPFDDATFDTVATASTFCSVPDPKQGLSELFRVLKPGGNLLMIEHVRSRSTLIALNQDMMNFIMRLLGSNLNRDTAAAVRSAGFVVDRIGSAYLDVFLAIEGQKTTSNLRSLVAPTSARLA